jgi:hypothetical protein
MYEVDESGHLFSNAAIDTRSIFRELLDLRIRNLRDTEGRPLREQMAHFPDEPIHTEFKRCPYPGTRHQHEKLMNVSALRQITDNWPAVMGAIGRIHMECRDRISGPLSVFDLWRIVNTGIMFPSFVALRAKNPYGDTELPVWIAGVYKVLIGIHTTVRPLMLQNLLANGQNAPLPTAQSMYDYVESIQGLIGAKEVCAGPPALILRSLRVVLDGGPDESADDAPFYETLERPAALAEFSEEAINLFILNFIFVARMRQISSRIRALLQQAEAAGVQDVDTADLLSRLDALAEEQSRTPAGKLSRQAEKAEGMNIGVLTTALSQKIGRTRPEYQGDDAKPLDAQAPLSQLLQEEAATYKALEDAFLADATELSNKMLVALGHEPGTQEVRHEDLVQVSGRTLGDVLEEVHGAVRVA